MIKKPGLRGDRQATNLLSRGAAERLKLTRALFTYSFRTVQRTHAVWALKTSPLMLYCEIISVCSHIHTKHVNTLCGQNVEFFSVNTGIH